VAKGKVIVLEGTDKAGKTTQSRLLMESLKASGKVCVTLDFPDYFTPIGLEIRAFLDGKRDYPPQAKHLLFSANRWEKQREIESMLDNGTIVVMNRYWQSNLVYGVSSGVDESWLLRLDKGLPKEDLVVVLLVPANTSSKRAEVQDSFEKDAALSTAAYRNYVKYSKKFGWNVLDGSKSKEHVHQEILKLVKKRLKI
jgi:dTMP kinase